MTKPFRLSLAQRVCRYLPPLLSQQIREIIYPRASALKDDYDFTVRAQTGSLLKSKTSDFHGYPFAVHGYYDWRRWAIANVLCSPGDVIIEIGSNIGTETIGFSDYLGASGRVYAFEPLPSNLSVLLENVRTARYRNITVYQCAVGDRCSSVRFAPPKQRENSGIGQVLWQDQTSEGIEVECITLDSIMHEVPQINMLFMDAEGAETRILRGARELIGRDAPYLVTEASEFAVRPSGSTIEELANELFELDYTVFSISRLGLSKLNNASDAQLEGNWFCAPRSQIDLSRRVSYYIFASAVLPCVANLNPLSRVT